MLVGARGGARGPGPFAQPEVWVVEDAARRWLATGSPYPAEVTGGADGYFPYLPGMAAFGLPHALLGDVVLADARLWFALATAAGVIAAAHATSRDRHGDEPVPAHTAAGWLLAGNPLVGLTLARGGWSSRPSWPGSRWRSAAAYRAFRA